MLILRSVVGVLVVFLATTSFVMFAYFQPEETSSSTAAGRSLGARKPLVMMSDSNASALAEVLAVERLMPAEKYTEALDETMISDELMSVDHGAWIIGKGSLPHVRHTETVDEFNERLVEAIIRELSKAWPPRVTASSARSLARRAYALDLERELDETVESAAESAKKNVSKVAFLFLVGGALPTEPLWRSFFGTPFARRRASVHVHPPPGFEFDEGSFFAPYALPQRSRIRVTWGSLAMVHAELALLATALRDPHNERFVLLSETDVPLWPFRCAYDALLSRPDLSFVESKKTLERFEMFDFGDAAADLAEVWRKGSQWFALSRDHAVELAKRRNLVPWYDAHARRQLNRVKVGRMGPLSQIAHLADKPNFADEHFVQTTLARRRLEPGLVPETLTFAFFGKENQFTVWGDGAKNEFKLHVAEWHAVQFGSLSWRAMANFHHLCDVDLDFRGPLDLENPSLEDRRRLVHALNSSDHLLTELRRRREKIPADQPLFPPKKMRDDEPVQPRRRRPLSKAMPPKPNPSWGGPQRARSFAEPFEPDRLRCSLDDDDDDPRKTKQNKFSPCFLFARKLHPEAVGYFGQLLATYFLAKTTPALASTLRRIHRVQRASSRDEIAAILANRQVPPGADYARRDMQALHSIFPATFFSPSDSSSPPSHYTREEHPLDAFRRRRRGASSQRRFSSPPSPRNRTTSLRVRRPSSSSSSRPLRAADKKKKKANPKSTTTTTRRPS
ncbi:hypothetical protein CTAYLR_009924 [Chrysophaeum taylorii]|uniref:Uncharacterized protein n=1 Tax=Chrysophaeum taylorii TaxID=2483200 RepID=A0AAD7UHV0_9STRA|nr:hypothetical protein CTAYLR_009924 [Chrysophaeum taylorii]